MTTNRRGITLTEVMIAMLVMVLGILPVLTLFGSEDKEAAFIGQKLVVQNYLRELADLTQSKVIVQHFQTGAFEQPPTKVNVGGDPKEGGFEATQRIFFFPSEKTPGLYVLRVEAHWSDPTGTLPGMREQVLTRLVCDPDYGTRHTAWPPGSSAASTP